MQIDGDIITLLALVIVAIMSFHLYRSVPRDVAEKIMDRGERAASKTPQAWDDDAIKLLRTIYDLLPKSEPQEPPAP